MATKAVKVQIQKALPAKNSARPKSTRNQAEKADEIILPNVRHWSLAAKFGLAGGVGAAILLVAVVVLRVSYAGRLYPGTQAFGVYLGGLTHDQAIAQINQQVAKYTHDPVLISMNGDDLRVNADDVGLQYDAAAAVDQAMQVGRSGSILTQFGDQLTYMLGHGNPNLYSVQFDNDKLATLYVSLNNRLASPVQNASLAYNLPSVTVNPGHDGTRIDIASFTQSLAEHVGGLDPRPWTIPTYDLAASVSQQILQPLTTQAARYTTGPLQLTGAGKNWSVDQNQIVSWLGVRGATPLPTISQDYIKHFYTTQPIPVLELNQVAIRNYLNGLAGSINVTPQDAELTVVNNQASVLTPSHDGTTLNIDRSLTAIINALEARGDAASRSVALAIDVKKPAVDSANLGDLGISDLLAEGVTYFPGSSSVRLNNIRVGQSKFNNVLIKPDQVFSFGQQMGPVTAAQGYLPGLVILNGHEENQYGGGMCQVSSTLFRAALQAGLPIVERHNHSFAVSFYTAPYGVPGVDATIYYPAVDLKIKNDTGHWILIQTHMEGTTLKFDLYGTKTKEGQIRGPQFIDGTNDATKPSTTVFWRDILVNGQVIKTDTFTTHYQSSLDFPISTD